MAKFTTGNRMFTYPNPKNPWCRDCRVDHAGSIETILLFELRADQPLHPYTKLKDLEKMDFEQCDAYQHIQMRADAHSDEPQRRRKKKQVMKTNKSKDRHKPWWDDKC